jgi:hypothetical protein
MESEKYAQKLRKRLKYSVLTQEAKLDKMDDK